MTFNSLQYAAFLPLVVLVYWRLGRSAQNGLLLVASYLFYGLYDWRFLGLLMISTATDYTVGRVLEVTEDEVRRRVAFVTSLVINLGILGVFKYYDFFVTRGITYLGRLGIHASPPLLHVLLPVGISFYTFHGMSYSFDVYRRHIRPTRNLLAFAVFVAFFPQLVAGPIGRAHLQLPQFERDRIRPKGPEVAEGLFLILMGLFKKVFIADALAPFVTSAFASPRSSGSATLVLGAYAFALEIYGDFAGYSDIARGSARLLGIDLPVNFDQPYLSRSVTEFWRRWHISLSNWLRDYLYVPLGGNRGTRWSVYRNLMLTMLIGGLWHGAATTFVIWGGIHGLMLVFERQFLSASARDAWRPYEPRRDLLRTVVTFNVVCGAWIFFRASSTGEAFAYLRGIAALRGGPIDSDGLVLLALAVAAMLVIDAAQYRARNHIVMLEWTPWAQGLVLATFALCVLVFSGGRPVPFIYFRF